MAKWHYDVTGAEAIIRDTRVYSASTAIAIESVMAMQPIGTEEQNGVAMLATPAQLDNIVGVTNEALTAAEALSVVAEGVDKYAKLIINPYAVYLCKYSQAAADDVPLTAADASGKTLTITQVTDHERCWTYITDTGGTTGGYGNLFQIGAVTGTTVVTAATSYDDNLDGNITGDTAIVLIAPYSADVAGGSVDLATNAVDVAGYNADAAAGAAVVLENYITSKTRPMEPLVCAKHSGYNYSSEAPQFYADVMFSETLLGQGGTTCTRIIN